jgi:hypothetical protein
MGAAGVTGGWRFTTQRLYLISLAVYGVSFLLPAVVNPSPTSSFGWVELWGWQAAYISVATPMIIMIGASNVGYAVAALLVAFGSPRAAIACAAAALADMAFCGIMLPAHAGDGPIRWPGGLPGPGYVAWLASGVVMVVCGVRAAREARDAQPPGLGLIDVPRTPD